MTINKLIQELKENNEDFEFYPTTKEMIKVIYEDLDDNNNNSVLDIGCGTCNFDKYFKELNQEREKINEENETKKQEEYKLLEEEYDKKFEEINPLFETNKDLYKEKQNVLCVEKNKKRDEIYNKYDNKLKTNYLRDYYVIEKSKILIDRLDKNKILLGTDFKVNTLIDKPVDVIFCNPPYSEFEEWTFKILDEGNFKVVYLIIPERWINNKEIKSLIDKREITYNILGSDDFEDAERKARAKVNIIKFERKLKHNNRLEDLNEEHFEEWFKTTFNINDEDEKIKDFDKEQKDRLENKIRLVSSKDKIKELVNCYNEEQNILFENFKYLCSLDASILETIGIKLNNIKEALKLKIKNLKILYWETAFNELEEITKHLTSKSINVLLDKFKIIKNVDFDLQNIYGLIVWVIKNSSDYSKDQLIDFYYSLSSFENVKPYKSNQKLFNEDKWRCFRDRKATHYNLDYRIVVSHNILDVYTSFDGEIRSDYCDYDNKKTLNDFKVILRNLGFTATNYDKVYSYGEKYYMYDIDGNILIEYKFFKNRNTHIKLNIEVAKALNVEVARLLGWIKSKEDIKKEFITELAEGAEKYFNINKDFLISNNSFLLDFTEVEK